MKKQAGITLIALIVTIIILIILAAVTVNVLLGENGIISKTKEAKEKHEIESYIERIELARGEVETEKLGEITLDDLIEKIYERNIVPQGNIVKIDEENARVVTKEEYEFRITVNKTTYIGKAGQVIGAKENIKFGEIIWNSETHRASVEISKSETISEVLSIQYQVNSTSGEWKNETKVEELKNGDIVYARLWDKIKGGEYISIEIKDTIAPNLAQIAFSKQVIKPEESTEITILQVDNQSDVNIEKSKYIINDSANSLGTDENAYTTAFTSNPQIINFTQNTKGSYYLHVLTVDNAGNSNETISSEITVAETLAWTFGYKGSDETWEVPYTGYYQIDCYGAQGSPGSYSGYHGVHGSFSGSFTNNKKR